MAEAKTKRKTKARDDGRARREKPPLNGTSSDDCLAMHSHGYEPIPVQGKAPKWTGWQHIELTHDNLPGIIEYQQARGHRNIGLRTARHPVIDIDLQDPGQSDVAEKAVEDTIGRSWLRRVGSKGCALGYKTDAPFKKMILLSGQDRLVEVLGDGQQYVAYGIHPDTGRPYDWTHAAVGGEPLKMPRDWLPEITYETALAALETIRDALVAGGFYSADELTISDPNAPRERNSTGSGGQGAGDLVTQEMMYAAAKHVDPNCIQLKAANGGIDDPMDAWIGMLCAIKFANVVRLDPETGEYKTDPAFDPGMFACEWSSGKLWGEAYAKYDEYGGDEHVLDTMDNKTDPDGATIRTLFAHARRHGYKGACFVPGTSEPFDAAEGTPFDEFDAACKSAPVLLGMPPENIHWLMYPFILEGFPNVWAGPGGLGKSETLMLIAVLMASGHAKVLGRQGATKREDDGKLVMEGERGPIPALFISSEDPEFVGRSRLKKIARHHKLDCASLPFDFMYKTGNLAKIDETGEVTPGPMLPWLKAKIERMGKRALVILDPITSFVSLDANLDTPVEALFKKVLGPLCNATGATIVAIKHPSRASRKDGQHVGGSEQWVNAPRCTTTFLAESNDLLNYKPTDPRIITAKKANLGGQGETHRLFYHPMSELPVEASHEAAVRQQADNIEAVYQAVASMLKNGISVQKSNMGSGQGPRGIAAKIAEGNGEHLSEKEVTACLEKLERDKRLQYTEARGKTTATFRVIAPAQEGGRRGKCG